MNEKQKYIKEKYFKLVSHDPLHYAPITDESMKLAPHNVIRIIDLIIKVLQSPDALFFMNFAEYIDPTEIKNTITRKSDEETDDEFRKRVLEKAKEMK